MNNHFSDMSGEDAYAVSAKAKAYEARGRIMFHFEMGQPDFKIPDEVIANTAVALCSGKTTYSPPTGIMELRTEIAKMYDVDPRRVAVTPSAKNAIFTALSAVVSPGIEVCVPDPGFPSYSAIVKYLGGTVVSEITPYTEVIVINSPNNPTGEILGPGDLQKIREKNLFVITDEIYDHIFFEHYDSYFRSFADPEKTILVNGFSKTYAMTGFRVGYMIYPEYMIDHIDHFLTHTVGCTNTFSQYGALAALKLGTSFLKPIVADLKVKREYATGFLNMMPGIECYLPTGAFYLFPSIKKTGKTCTYMSDYLLSKGVATLPGGGFGEKGNGHLRLSYAVPMVTLQEGLSRMNKILKEL